MAGGSYARAGVVVHLSDRALVMLEGRAGGRPLAEVAGVLLEEYLAALEERERVPDPAAYRAALEASRDLVDPPPGAVPWTGGPPFELVLEVYREENHPVVGNLVAARRAWFEFWRRPGRPPVERVLGNLRLDVRRWAREGFSQGLHNWIASGRAELDPELIDPTVKPSRPSARAAATDELLEREREHRRRVAAERARERGA